ncbi:MAG: sulfite exporter TauE/SafE family protein [Spirochaetes bacterium]|nr:sulfite exporter TauE/SafE family protein [Spirochaetota bacterium]
MKNPYNLTKMVPVPSSIPLSWPMFYGWTVVLGFGIGVLTGLFGVGGGFLIVPLLHVLLGVPYSIAVGSSLLFILGTSALAIPGHYKQGNFEPRAVFYLSLGSVTGSLIGDLLQDLLVLYVAKGNILVFNQWMHSLFIGLLFVTSGLLLWPAVQSKGGASGTDRVDSSPLQRLSFPPFTYLKRANLPRISIPGLIVLGCLVGLLTGLLGVGGGVLFMPILLLVVGLPPKLSVGTSLGVVFFAALAGTIKKTLSLAPKISLPLTASLLLGSTLGVRMGIRINERIEGARIRQYFVLVIVLALGVLIWDLLRA